MSNQNVKWMYPLLVRNDSKLESIYNNWDPIHRIYAWIRANEDNKTVSIYRQKNKILNSAYGPYTSLGWLVMRK